MMTPSSLTPAPRTRLRYCIAAGVVSLLAVQAQAAELYVAPDGQDANPGTKDKPLATLAAARDRIRLARKAGPLAEGTTVYLRGGTYRLTAPIVLEPADCGAEGKEIVYRAMGGEKPILSGGVAVTGWRREGEKLWAADVPWARQRAEPFTQLFVNGVRRPRARTPNEGSYFYTHRLRFDDGGQPQCLSMTWANEDLGPWANQPGALVVLFHNWVSSCNYVGAFDAARRRIDFARPAGIFFLGPRVRYYVENVRAALDAPGEWYLDHVKGVLYYYPPPGQDVTQAEVIAPVVTQSLVVIQGNWQAGRYVQHVAFEGLSFQHTDADLSRRYEHSVQGSHTQKGAIFARGLRHGRIEDCEFTRLGEHAISLGEGCAHNTIRRCHVHDTGGGGVYLSKDSPRNPPEALLTAHNVVDNNFIHDGGRIFRAACGVFLGGSASYNRITHNEICDLSWMGVHAGWSWTGKAPAHTHHNEIGWNHIHHLGNGVLNDIGGIYTLGVSPGTVLHHNLIHDVTRFERGREGYGGWGIYLDAGSSLIRVENNVVYRTRDGGLHVHNFGYPYGDVVANNVFACSDDAELIRNANHEPQGTHVHLERNIVYGKGRGMLGGSNWKKGSKFTSDRNCFWSESPGPPDFAGRTFAQWQAEGNDRNSIVADPGFVDPKRGDFRLKPGSPAAKIGFQPIDITAIGLYGPDSWRGLPLGVQHRPYEKAVEPPPSVQAIGEGFEGYEAGERPDDVTLSEESKAATIRVSADQAASGMKSLKFTDAPGQRVNYNPHMSYAPRFHEGLVRGRFAVRLEPGAEFYHEWRDWPVGERLRAGPSLRVLADGTLLAAGKRLAQLPHRQWVRIEIVCGTGPQATGRWQLTVQVPGQEARRFEGLACSPEFRTLTWYGFVSLADAKTVFHVDDIELAPVQP